MIKVVCRKSAKSGRVFKALMINEIYVSFDEKVILKVAHEYGLLTEVYSIAEGDEIIIK